MTLLRFAAGGAVLSLLIGVLLTMVLSVFTGDALQLVLILYLLASPGLCLGCIWGLHVSRGAGDDAAP